MRKFNLIYLLTRHTYFSPSILSKMPKVTLPSLPISSLFGMYKPSGPTSMAVINDLKRLVSASRLFIQEDIASENAEKLYRSKQEGVENKEDKGRRRKKRGGRVLEAKMGQGGTLDPLADGVLGMFIPYITNTTG